MDSYLFHADLHMDHETQYKKVPSPCPLPIQWVEGTTEHGAGSWGAELNAGPEPARGIGAQADLTLARAGFFE